LHHVRLAYPIRVFCSGFVDPEPVETDWLDSELDRKQLQADMMYVWLEFYLRDKLGKPHHFFEPNVLSPITEYSTWTKEKFLEVIGELSDTKKKEYHDKGFRVE
jgi:hypothetical protein